MTEGNLVIAMDRPIISTGINAARLAADDVPALLLQRVGRRTLAQELTPGFVELFLNGPRFREQVTGQAVGTQLPHISANDIESSAFPLPPASSRRRSFAVSQRCSTSS